MIVTRHCIIAQFNWKSDILGLQARSFMSLIFQSTGYKVEIIQKHCRVQNYMYRKVKICLMVQRSTWQACVLVHTSLGLYASFCNFSFTSLGGIKTWWEENYRYYTTVSFPQAHEAFNSIHLNRNHANKAVVDFCTPQKLPLTQKNTPAFNLKWNKQFIIIIVHLSW